MHGGGPGHHRRVSSSRPRRAVLQGGRGAAVRGRGDARVSAEGRAQARERGAGQWQVAGGQARGAVRGERRVPGGCRAMGGDQPGCGVPARRREQIQGGGPRAQTRGRRVGTLAVPGDDKRGTDRRGRRQTRAEAVQVLAEPGPMPQGRPVRLRPRVARDADGVDLRA